MAAEWLRADQVAAIGQRAREAARDCTKPGGWKNAAVYVAEQDIPSLVAQDGRWRALVGVLYRACYTAAYCETPEHDARSHDEVMTMLGEAVDQAQAALDGAE